MAEKWNNYTLDGYDPDDGLKGGRWMRDDIWGVVRWVQLEKRTCSDCRHRDVGPRSTLCATCTTRRRRQARKAAA